MKKNWLLALAAIALVGCSESSSSTSSEMCGNGVVDEGEACDTGLSVECSKFDASKTWVLGGVASCSDDCSAVSQGTCTEAAVGGSCGDGTVNVGEKCDPKADTLCKAIDSNKKWKDGGKAACSADCQTISAGTCVEAVAENKCGNGIVDDGEKCDPAAQTACSAFDSEKTWAENGLAACSADCQTVEIGSCQETVEGGECGDGTLNVGEKCDPQADTPCTAVDPNKTWKDGGKAECSADCQTVSAGTCVEVGTANKCGDGNVDEGEKCDTAAQTLCSAFDSEKTWKEGGFAECSADCQTVSVGTCVEVGVQECNVDDDCADKAPLSHCNTAKKCVECYEDKHCADIADKPVCNTTLFKCEESEGPLPEQCTDSSQCPKAAPVCSANGACVTCSETDKCPDGFACKNDGTCEEICGNGKLDAGEACDKNLDVSCDKLDSNKVWEDGGKAACSADCKKVETGTCKEKTVTGGCKTNKDCPAATPVCKASTGKCEICTTNNQCEAGRVCLQADNGNDKKGTCVEGACATNNDCTKNTAAKQCDLGSYQCVECLENKHCTNKSKQACEPSTHQCVACVEDKDCVYDSTKKACDSANNTCVACLKNDHCTYDKNINICDTANMSCVQCMTDKDCNATKKEVCYKNTCQANGPAANCSRPSAEGIYWCQLMVPVKVTFDDTTTSETLNGKYQVGTDVDASKLVVELVYGKDFTSQASWKSITATFKDGEMSANLTKDLVAGLGTGVTSAYYTFRLRENSTAEWKYCKSNQAEQAATLDCSLKPYSVSSSTHGNANQSGMATVSTVATSNLIAEFNFDALSKLTTLTSTSNINADKGSGTLNGSGKNGKGTQCTGGNCVSKHDSGNALNVKNWKTAKADAIKDDAANLNISGLKMKDSNNNLTIDISRNAGDSPNNVAILYSLDGTSYTDINSDIALNADTDKYATYEVELPSALNGKSGVTIRIAPYNVGSKALRFDNIIIQKK